MPDRVISTGGQHVDEHQRRRSPLSAAVQNVPQVPQSRNTLTPAAVLRLQRSVGNRAVGRLLISRAVPEAAIGGLSPGIAPDEENVLLGGAHRAQPARPQDRQNSPIQRDHHTPEAVAAAKTVSATTNSGPTWNANGAFDWRVGFTTSGRSGWLVQKIENALEGTDSAGKAFTKALPTPMYWEAWAVGADGKVTPAVGANNDYWIRPTRGASSKGSWSMKAQVHFSTTDPATQGFTAGGAKDSGILLSTTSAPAGLGSVLLNRTADGSWDGTGDAPKVHKGAAS